MLTYLNRPGERNLIFFAVFPEEMLVLQSVGKAREKMAKVEIFVCTAISRQGKRKKGKDK